MKFRIVQISDCHIQADDGLNYRGHLPAQRLRQLVAKIGALKPNLIVASGDISQDGSIKSYQLFVQRLEPLHCPVLTLPGNHDDPTLLAASSHQSWDQTPYSIDNGIDRKWAVLALNTRWEGHVEGKLSAIDVERIRQLPTDTPCIVFCHHHPLAIETPWIDRFPLVDGIALVQTLNTMPQVKALAFGHIHHAWRGRYGHLQLLGCPASSVNTQPGVVTFTDDGQGAKARCIDLFPAGRLQSSIIQTTGSDHSS